jgi:hypothetical protein
MVRQARSRAEYAGWYPTIPLGGGNSPRQAAASCSANCGMGRLPGRPVPGSSPTVISSSKVARLRAPRRHPASSGGGYPG